MAPTSVFQILAKGMDDAPSATCAIMRRAAHELQAMTDSGDLRPLRHRPLAVALIVFACAGCTTGSDAGTEPTLEGTSWQLLQFEGGDDTILTPDDPMKYTIAFGADERVSVRFDCNRGNGTWKSLVPGQLELGELALTRAYCGPSSLHDQLARQWQFIRSYVLRDGHLFLALMADGGIYELEPRPASAGDG
jgi:heat shock protein HslJ